MIKLYAWTDVPNFGDALSASVVEWVSGKQVQLVASSARNKLLAVGSVLQHAWPGDVIWGTGVHPYGFENFWKNPNKTKLQLTVLAVRGPITRDVLLARGVSCPAIYGDPALLLPLFYPKPITPTYDAVLIPHFCEYPYFAKSQSVSLGVRVVDPGTRWQDVVDAVISSKLVISSSLHGLIVAETYGVPSVWFRPTQGEGYLKYQDYYGATHRAPTPVYDLREALTARPIPVPDLSGLRRVLVDAFDKKLVEELCTVMED